VLVLLLLVALRVELFDAEDEEEGKELGGEDTSEPAGEVMGDVEESPNRREFLLSLPKD